MGSAEFERVVLDSEGVRMSYTELLIGCGSRREKLIKTPGYPEWENVRTLDINPDHKPNVLWDLTVLPLPMNVNSYNEVHAYEVLEHTGMQGDYRFFFAQFSEFWRILKPNGLLCATVPSWKSEWAWGDPSHTRIITPGTLVFLSRKEYQKQVGVTAMSDFRYLYKADFDILYSQCDGNIHAFVLRAVK